MNQDNFIKRARSILSDNNGARLVPHKLSGTALDVGHLALADAGERRIFAHAERRKYADYNFMLLVDVSGSMSGAKEECAAASVHALYIALKAAGARVQAIYFNAEVAAIPEDKLNDADELFKFLGARVHGRYHGCNHDGYAVQEAVKRLMKTASSTANVLLVFSDGQPACGCDEMPGNNYEIAKLQRRKHGDPCAYLMAHVDKARRAGIKVLAVDIQEGSAKYFYGERNTVLVMDLDELYPKACNLLETNLRRE